MGKVYATLTNLALAAALTIGSSRVAAVESTRENFVATAMALQGTSGTVPRMNFFGVPVVSPIACAGKATAAGTGTITDTNATWKQDQFNGTNGYYYVELDSGLTADITLAPLGAGDFVVELSVTQGSELKKTLVGIRVTQ